MAKIDRISRGLFQGMKTQRDAHLLFSDVEVEVEARVFKCHRFLLSAASHFFRGLFSSSMMESESDRVPIKGISADIFSTLYDFIYTGRLEITWENIFDIWHAANQLQMDVLLQECEMFGDSNMATENCVKVFINAKQLDSAKLIDRLWSMIIKEFEQLRRDEDLLFLDIVDMLCLLRDGKLNVTSEDSVIDLIKRWCLVPGLRADGKARHDSMGELLRSARICLASSSCIQNLLQMDGIQNDKEAFKALKEGSRYHLQHGRRHDYCPNSAVHRQSSSHVNVLATIVIQEDGDSVFSMRNNRTGVWFASPFRISGRLVEGSMISFGEFIYGNIRNCVKTSRCYYKEIITRRYDTILNQWSKHSTPPDNTDAEGSYKYVAVGEYIYAVGGDTLDNVKRYHAQAHIPLLRNKEEDVDEEDDDEEDDEEEDVEEEENWENVGKLLQPVDNIALMAFEDSIVVFGSRKDKPDESVVQKFDLMMCRCKEYLNDAPGPSASAVTLKNEDGDFLLQQNGSLWRLVCCEPLELVYEESFWADGELILHGATICQGQLMVTATIRDSQEIVKQWTSNKTFSKIVIFNRPGSCCLINTVVPLTSLTERDPSFIEPDW